MAIHVEKKKEHKFSNSVVTRSSEEDHLPIAFFLFLEWIVYYENTLALTEKHTYPAHMNQWDIKAFCKNIFWECFCYFRNTRKSQANINT